MSEVGEGHEGRDIDDLSNGFHRVRSRLVDSKGVGYYDFRKTLTPRYWRVWADLLAGHMALAVLIVLLLLIRHSPLGAQLLAGGAAALVFGVLFAYLSLFFHAASHYELWPTRKLNDLWADLLIGIFSAYPMAKYRPTHFDHHRYLGLPEDPERGYIESLNLRLLVEILTGVRFVKLFWSQVRGSAGGGTRTAVAAEKMPAPTAPTVNWVMPCSILLHLGLVLGALWLGAIALAVGWVVGFIFVARLVSALRIALEHRSEHANPAIDYNKISHGAVSRLFGDGPLAQTMGGAGFNRHLLHHWDPQVPYTRLKDLEIYLRDTELRPVIEARSTSYATAFLRLFQF